MGWSEALVAGPPSPLDACVPLPAMVLITPCACEIMGAVSSTKLTKTCRMIIPLLLNRQHWYVRRRFANGRKQLVISVGQCWRHLESQLIQPRKARRQRRSIYRRTHKVKFHGCRCGGRVRLVGRNNDTQGSGRRSWSEART